MLIFFFLNPSCEIALKGISLDAELRQATLGCGHSYFGLLEFQRMKPVNTTRLELLVLFSWKSAAQIGGIILFNG